MRFRAATAGLAFLTLVGAAPGGLAERRADLAGARSDAQATATAIHLISRRIAANEPQVAALQTRIAQLDRERQTQRVALAAQQAEVVQLLAVLQNLSRRPQALLLTQPQSAADAARISLLLDTVVPQLRIRTAGLRAQIERTAATRDRLAAERARLDAVQTALALDQRRLERAGEALASRLASLEQLVDELARSGAAAARPTIAMSRPVAGRLLAGFGAANELGLSSQGLRWRTVANADVMAPSDGRVAFTGPFRTYGRIIIIEHGPHLLSLLAGLETTTVSAGQAVRGGQAVGRMGTADPTLYFELRSGGEPVDPRPWLRARKSSQR